MKSFSGRHLGVAHAGNEVTTRFGGIRSLYNIIRRCSQWRLHDEGCYLLKSTGSVDPNVCSERASVAIHVVDIYMTMNLIVYCSEPIMVKGSRSEH